MILSSGHIPIYCIKLDNKLDCMFLSAVTSQTAHLFDCF